MKNLLIVVICSFIALAGFVGYQITELKSEVDTLGAFRPSGYTGKLLTRLNEGGAEATFNTTPCTTPDGQSISTATIGDFIVITINPGGANEEKISASAASCSGTTLTWTVVNRGLSFVSTQSVTANKKQHAVGETVIISNDDQFLTTQYLDVDGNQSVLGYKTFTNGANFTVTPTTTDQCNSTGELCNFDYITGLSFQGGATSTENNLGLVELATALEIGSSTASSTEGRPLVALARYATTSPSSTLCNGTPCLVASYFGKLRQSWLNLTEAFTWTGTHIFNGAVQIAATVANPFTLNTLNYNLPSIRGASSTALMEDGAGNLRWLIPNSYVLESDSRYQTSSGSTSTTTLKTVVIPANTLGTNNMMNILANWYSSTGTSCYFETQHGSGVSTTTVYDSVGVSGEGFATTRTSIMATSTSAIFADSIGNSQSAGNTSSTIRGYLQPYSLNTAATTYVALNIRSTAGGNCILTGYSVQIIGRQ